MLTLNEILTKRNRDKETIKLVNKFTDENGNSKSDDVVEFSLFIETLASKKKLTLMDTMLDFCEEFYIDPLEVIPQISKSLKDKIEIELIEEGKLPRFTTKSLI